LFRYNFSKDTADRPEIDRSGVFSCTEKELWGAVPESNNFFGIRTDGEAESSSEPEISDL
jgi:hypothetical protein